MLACKRNAAAATIDVAGMAANREQMAASCAAANSAPSPVEAAPHLDLRGSGPADDRLLIRLSVLEHRQHLVVGQQAKVLLNAAGGIFENSSCRRRGGDSGSGAS